ncbi:fatty acid desaturase family protein [Pseudosporangium ferrugineum]|uniref:Fatty acid desaturase n=1 Tax=Pseudosporangium ferrugineum TaxID=439699 RepID=A0A2T0SDB5_9ACTN|nr:acyl-CoA desaturase [Pseudosporangium ferrugineum]PRY31407.1 fatty acid desaturase [Pseudosporangium ferrugineum]
MAIDALNSTTTARGSAYAALSRQVKAAGLLDRRPGYYAAQIALMLALVAAAWTALVVVGDSWWQLLVATFFAVVSTQLGFLGHDAGHRQIFGSSRRNYRLGVVLANLGVGFSYGWWIDKHNRHHAHPNDEDKDPDIGAGALVFTTGQAQASGRVARMFYRYQAWAFFPLLFLEALHLRVASVRYLLSVRSRAGMRELLFITLHLAAYLAAVFVLLPPGKALAFVAVHQGLFGLYLGCSFAPNHKGMPPLSPEDDADFLRRQVLTSRNVRGNWLTDFALGGLNYQIEHHLFPSMPRGNLRKAQRLVRDFCAEHQVSYLETGLVSSYAQALRHLDTVGRTPAPVS